MTSINRTLIHQIAKELKVTVQTLRNRYTGYAVIQGFDTLDDLIHDDLSRGLTIKQIANILKQGV